MVKYPRSFDSSQTFGLLDCACHWLYNIQTLYKPITWKRVLNITTLTASRVKQWFYSENIHSSTIARWGETANWLHLPAPFHERSTWSHNQHTPKRWNISSTLTLLNLALAFQKSTTFYAKCSARHTLFPRLCNWHRRTGRSSRSKTSTCKFSNSIMWNWCNPQSICIQPPVLECLYNSNKLRAMKACGGSSGVAPFFNFGTR
jgi:hypothetical protein